MSAKGIFERKNLSIAEIYAQFITGMKATGPLEYIAVFSGIASVWFSRKGNVLVYPVGLVGTIIYVYLSLKQDLAGEAAVNFYYTVMSIVGWYMWLKKNNRNEEVLHISFSSAKEIRAQILFFLFFYISIFGALTFYKSSFFPGSIPWADALASSTAFTGMWLMTKKKVESWYWWLATNITSVPLYFVKGMVFTSVYYAILFVMAIFGLRTWIQQAKTKEQAH